MYSEADTWRESVVSGQKATAWDHETHSAAGREYFAPRLIIYRQIHFTVQAVPKALSISKHGDARDAVRRFGSADLIPNTVRHPDL